MANPLVIYGAGGHAHSLIDLIESSSAYNVAGLIDNSRAKGSKAFGIDVLGTDENIVPVWRELDCHFFVAIGDNYQRQRVTEKIKSDIPSVQFATLVHTNAYVSPRAALGMGVAVMSGASINAGCKVDEGVVINSHSTLDHDCAVEAFASLAPGVVVGGNVILGSRSFLGIGSKIAHKVSIANDVCVGAGSTVVKSCEQETSLYYGSPAKFIRSRKVDEKYL